MMPRRQFLVAAATLAAGAAQADAAPPARPSILHLTRLELRNSPDDELRRTQDFLGSFALPALQSAGAASVGVFRSSIGPDSPFVILLSEFPSLAAFEAADDRVWSNAAFAKAYADYTSSAPRVYERVDVSLLRSFPGFPAVKPPKPKDSGSHIFELRRYESPNGVTLARKIRMFDEGESGIFERLGMKPVFFGSMLAGERMPNLMYMLCFDSLAERERLWGRFVSDPEWKKISSPPEFHDSEIVSNISNWILEPIKFSPIR